MVVNSGNSVYVIIPVHNRKLITLRCMENLRETKVLSWAKVVVVDDGSTDGTAEAILQKFPDATILRGDGNLWWTGAIVKGMKFALEQGAKYIFWLNDDCIPSAGTMHHLFEYSHLMNCISVAISRTRGGAAYGGVVKNPWGLKLVNIEGKSVVWCDTMQGNCVCLPVEIVNQIGLPNALDCPHARGDSEYGLRSSAAGWKIALLPDAECWNEDNLKEEQRSWLLSNIRLKAIWGSFFYKGGYLYYRSEWHVLLKYWGWRGVLMFFYQYLKAAGIILIRILIPYRVRLALFGGRSRIFQIESKLS